MKYRKLPVVIEAIQWTGTNDSELLNFMEAGKFYFKNGNHLYIKTLEGDHRAIIGDYIIKGIKGEFYPCKEDIFLKTYEEVKNENS